MIFVTHLIDRHPIRIDYNYLRFGNGKNKYTSTRKVLHFHRGKKHHNMIHIILYILININTTEKEQQDGVGEKDN